MQNLQLNSRLINPLDFRGLSANKTDCTKHVDEPCVVYVNGNQTPSIVYLQIPEMLENLVQTLKKIKFSTSSRTMGMISTSRTFGYAPRKVVRGRESCHNASLDYEHPELSKEVCNAVKIINDAYKLYVPDIYEKHLESTKVVLDDWKLGSTPFTSGIINKDNRLPYHFDGGNFKDCWSNMVTFKHAIIGGHLACPEIDTCFELRDNTLLMFDGQKMLHGVTAFSKLQSDSYRYTVVYYSLHNMWQCLPPAEEISRAATKRMEREKKIRSA